MRQWLAAIHASFEPAVGEAGKSRASIAHKTSSTILATRAEILTLPCANKYVPVANLTALKSTLSEAGLQQINEGLQAAFAPDEVCDIVPDSNIVPSPDLPQAACENLIKEDAIERVTPEQLHREPTKSSGRGFFIKDVKVDETGTLIERVRFIYWSKRQNAALKSSSSRYRVKTHMYHTSYYMSAIRAEAAVVGDIKSGFSHIAIPKKARAWFRFEDEDGNVYQMCRLPLGLVPSCQIMEVVTLALIGSPIVCATPYITRPDVRVDGYVDDFRAAGSTRALEYFTSETNRRAALFNVQLKKPLEIAESVTFLGVVFDHGTKQVRIAPKTLSKLPDSIGSSVAAGLLYRTVARLIFCSAPLKIGLFAFYMTMKHTTSVCNKINNRVIDDETLISVPEGLRSSINRWIQLARGSATYDRDDWAPPTSPRCTLYTDASLRGWGAHFISSTGAVYIVGGKWRDPSQLSSKDINQLEGRAVRYAFSALKEHILRHRVVDLRIDNTSVLSAMQRGRGKAETVHFETLDAIKFAFESKIVIKAEYVASAENKADITSRTS